MNFLSTPKKDPMIPKARCKVWTTQTQNRKGGGEKKAPERERERERERVPPHLSTYLLLQGKALKKKASTFTRTETTQSSFPLVWFSLLNSSLNRVRRRETEEESAEGSNCSGQQQRLTAKVERERERERES